MQVIRRDELNVSCEREVYEAVICWVQYDVEKRSQKLDALIAAVRCHFLSPHFLTSQLNSCPILRRSSTCGDYLQRVVDELTQHHHSCRERRRRPLNQAIYIIGGYLRHSLATVECWNPVSKKWYQLASLTTPRSGIAACQVSMLFAVLLSCQSFCCDIYVWQLHSSKAISRLWVQFPLGQSCITTLL